MERILTLNIGATRLVLAEFAARPGRGPALLHYAFGDLPEGAAETPETLSLELERTLRGMLATGGIRPGRIQVALSGQMAFPRFVKVLADDPAKMQEQINFEVEQNVPFPLTEAIWDRALVGQPEAGEQHVMIVAARADVVNAVTRALLNAGCEPELVDVAPVALYNAVRFNYPDEADCTLVVDIGARSTNLVFVEQDRIFYRTIPVAGNTITAEIAKNFGISLEEAEELKCTRGLVAQGGAFAVDDPEVDRLSKVIRNVMTRLNAEVSRSVSFYRSQQDGSAPARVLLTGATSQLPYMQNFFEEKLQVETAFLNPFQTVGYPESADVEQFGRDAFSLATLVGLALRRGLTCPAEINLVSQDIVARKAFRRRVPFLVLSAVGLVAALGIWILFLHRLGDTYERQRLSNQSLLSDCEDKQERFERADKKAKDAAKRADAYRALLARRLAWQERMIAVDKSIDDGLWLTRLNAVQTDGRPTGLHLAVSVWKDVEKQQTKNNASKTIDEMVVDRLKEQTAIFAENGVKVTSRDTKLDWLTSFELTAGLAGAESDAKPSSRRR